MSNCCSNKACELEILKKRQSKTLKIVLLINAAMFFIEFYASVKADSISLLADSLDMLGDALIYGFSIYAVHEGARTKAISALFKGIIMTLFGVFALVQVIYKILVPHLPNYETIGLIGLMALLANAICFMLLWQHRSDDINMSSVWLCSRNDIIANTSVILASFGIWLLGNGWPDIIIGSAIAYLFIKSSISVLTNAIYELRHTKA